MNLRWKGNPSFYFVTWIYMLTIVTPPPCVVCQWFCRQKHFVMCFHNYFSSVTLQLFKSYIFMGCYDLVSVCFLKLKVRSVHRRMWMYLWRCAHAGCREKKCNCLRFMVGMSQSILFLKLFKYFKMHLFFSNYCLEMQEKLSNRNSSVQAKCFQVFSFIPLCSQFKRFALF